MKETLKKSVITFMVAALIVAAAPIMAMAADAPVDENDVYGQDAVTVANIENSPALKVDSSQPSGSMSSGTEAEDEAPAATSDLQTDIVADADNNTPNTGVTSLALPMGTALLSLGAMAVILKKKD